jgi:hypothetical protein
LSNANCADPIRTVDMPAGSGDLDHWRAIGDPLADAVIAELAAHDDSARRNLDLGLSAGLSAVKDPLPALRAFLEACEAAGNDDLSAMRRGSDAYLSIGATWIALSLGPGSLTHTYSAPSIARVLADTGNLTRMAARRLLETGSWNTTSVVPGALQVGAAGYVHNLQVRLLHARVRHALIRRGWDDAASLPINQLELARTWLDFTFIPFQALDRLGIRFTQAELRDLYCLWHRIAALIGVAPELYRAVVDQVSGAHLLSAIDAHAPLPDEASRQLTAAMLGAVATLLAPRLRVGRATSLGLARAILRRLHGDTLADQLGVPRSPVALALPAIILANRLARRHMRRSPARRAEVIAETLAAFDEANRDLAGKTTYQRALDEPVDDKVPQTIAPQ